MEMYNKILEDCKQLDDYEKSDLLIDLFKDINKKVSNKYDQWSIDDLVNDTIIVLLEALEKNLKYNALSTIIDQLLKSVEDEAKKELSKKDDGYHNVKLESLEREYNTLKTIEGLLY